MSAANGWRCAEALPHPFAGNDAHCADPDCRKPRSARVHTLWSLVATTEADDPEAAFMVRLIDSLRSRGGAA